MRVTTLLVASILLFMVSSTEGRTTRTQHAPRPLSAADVEHGLKSAVPNARMAALGKAIRSGFRVDPYGQRASFEVRERATILFSRSAVRDPA